MTDQENSEEKKSGSRTKWIYVGLFFSILAIGIGGFSYGFFELSKINSQLAGLMSSLQTRLNHSQQDIATIQTTINNMQQSVQKAQTLSTQQEQLMSDWHAAEQGNLDKWRIAEAQYLTKMADNYLQFSRNIKVAIELLKQANNGLANVKDPGLLEIRKSLTSDIASLEAIPVVDVTAIYLRLNALNDQINKLRLPENAIQKDENQKSPTVSKDLPWWKAGLAYTWQGLSKMVIVRKSDANGLPLALPEERTLLYQSIHAQIENAVWALLHENTQIYQASLSHAATWVQQYFQPEAQETKVVLQELNELQKMQIQSNVSTLSVLPLFDQYLAQSKTGQ